MQDSQVEEIKSKLNILDIVGGYVKLSKTGINYRGICPFHSEKGPSFFVSPARQMFKCFGCGKVGDIYEFIKEIEGVEFGDALKILAAKAGVELKRENPKLKTERQRLYEICQLACLFFEKQLEGGAAGKEAKEYLLKRGINEESIKRWRLGYSPDTWQGLSDFLVGKGYDRQEIVKAGLAVASEKGNNPYDRFRGRIIFPIFDSNSQAVGFGARVFPAHGGSASSGKVTETAKYINTPQTLLYDKSNTLYGINYAKVAVRKNNQCVITEGYTDAIMCHQSGFENTVASSGTALTPRHLSILKRYTENLVLAFDMDLAGDSATKRGINLAESQGFNIKIIDTYSGAKDPAEIIFEDPKIWGSSVAKARTIMEYYFDSAFSKYDKAIPEDKKQIGRIILPAIKRIQNKIEQSHWIQKLAQKLEVREEAVIAELNSVKDEGRPTSQGFAGSDPATDLPVAKRKKLVEQKIVALAAKNPENLNLIEEIHYPLFSEETKNMLEGLKNNNLGLAEPLAELVMKAETEFEEDGEEELKLCLLQLKDIKTREELGRISGDVKKAEESGDVKKTDILVEDFNKLSREIL